MRAKEIPVELVSLMEQLPGCRMLIAPDYRIVAAKHCSGEGSGPPDCADVAGRHCYEVSHGYDSPCDQHGESCPLRAAVASGRPERCVHVHHSSEGPEHIGIELVPLHDARGRVSMFLERMEPLSRATKRPAYVGAAPAFLGMLDLVRRVGPSETAVLLLGETGTGKELMARAVHDASARRDGPFVVVDCAGLTETLFESELFGHEKGSFTGAVGRKLGLVEAASRGTLFIDEIGDIPLALQVKLLRLLETGLFRRVGGTEMQRTDFRLVAATHRDLQRMVEQGLFRADLYYRITAFPITVPALRDRRSDVAAISTAILGRLEHCRPLSITQAALAALVRYDYPGNVRELRNILERASLLTDTGVIDTEQLPEHVRKASDTAIATSDSIEDPLLAAEHEFLRHALTQHRGLRRDLARRLSISERTLYRKLRGLREHSAPAARTENAAP